MERKHGPALPKRLYVRSIFTGYRRGLRNQHEGTALLKLEGVHTPEDAKFYLGKRAVYVYKANKKVGRNGGTKVRAVWGRITRVHGNCGAVRSQFHRNLPASAMGKRVRVMLYPSNI
uniref:Large ribosomal subunit protein eL33 n=1 Tax=Panagrolaimus sp. PS1159 TaxID=55785 RepID=A0AC35FYC5_9BILA